MIGGLRPLKHDHRDYDLLKTKEDIILGGIQSFPDSYCTDARMWMPDQDAWCNLFIPPVPPQPMGCTNYTQSDLLNDEDHSLHNPQDLENITHANANGGTDLRTSLAAVIKLHPDHPTYFTVRPDFDRGGYVDWFDAIRLAMTIGLAENRAVSVGTPWFPAFMHPQNGVIPAPSNWSIAGVPWHNWACKGWVTRNGITYLIAKPWIGSGYGDGGFGYFSRETFNRLMAIPGTGAFTLDKLLPGEVPARVDSTIKQWLVSFFTNLLRRI